MSFFASKCIKSWMSANRLSVTKFCKLYLLFEAKWTQRRWILELLVLNLQTPLQKLCLPKTVIHARM